VDMVDLPLSLGAIRCKSNKLHYDPHGVREVFPCNPSKPHIHSLCHHLVHKAGRM